MDIVPAGDALWLKNADFVAKIMKQVGDLEKNLSGLLGRSVPTAELKEMLGDAAEDGVASTPADSVDYSEVLSNL
jgi:hypothetical protein